MVEDFAASAVCAVIVVVPVHYLLNNHGDQLELITEHVIQWLVFFGLTINLV